MQKNLYYRQVLRRRNVLLDTLVDFFLWFSSYPRLLIEVFIRKNFGDRYFNLASVITVAVLLMSVPFVEKHRHLYELSDVFETITSNLTWYLFIGLFIGFSVVRYRELKTLPSVFDFGRFSLSSGDINPLFFQIKLFKVEANERLIETIYEPLPFLFLGLILGYFKLPIGYTIAWASIFYGLSYFAAYRKGDDFVKDKIDEMILNGQMEKNFVGDEMNNDHGVRVRAEKPTSKELREGLLKSFRTNDDLEGSLAT